MSGNDEESRFTPSTQTFLIVSTFLFFHYLLTSPFLKSPYCALLSHVITNCVDHIDWVKYHLDNSNEFPPSLPIFDQVVCTPLTLGNGTVIGNCSGVANATCMYAGCDDGFLLSPTGSVNRTCQANGTYTGNPKTCIREKC